MGAATVEREFVRDDNKKRCYNTQDFDTVLESNVGSKTSFVVSTKFFHRL